MTLHTKLSYVKSAVRIVGYAALGIAGVVANIPGMWVAAAALIAAEIIGIAEEAWPGAYEGTETVSQPAGGPPPPPPNVMVKKGA